MELTLDSPTGQKLRLDSDRQLDRPAGDSVMRLQANGPDGAQSFDAAFVETDEQEAQLIGWLLHEAQHPSPQSQERIAQDVQAAFPAKISGRDAGQIAQIVSKSVWKSIQQQTGLGDEAEAHKIVSKLAERFNRAAAKRREPASAGDRQRTTVQSSR